MKSIWFITPAHKRYELSDIVFHQRKLAIEKLHSVGIEAYSVVVADDRNLEIAAKYGHYTVEQNNEFLGRKFNDGYQYAAENGAEFFVPVGSDSWLDPTFLIDSATQTVTASRHYQVVRRDGERRLQIWVPMMQGVTYCLPRSLLKMANFRPVGERLMRGCDTAVWYNLGKPDVFFKECHAYETVAFQSYPQITSYNKLKAQWEVSESTDPFSVLSGYYPKGLVDQIVNFYRSNSEEMTVRQIVREELTELLGEMGLQLARG